MQRTLNRLRAEFLDMPGLRLTFAQVHRLCGIQPELCQIVLRALIDEKFLCLTADGTFARLSEDRIAHVDVDEASFPVDTKSAQAS